MPRYDFKCRECSAVFEAVVPISMVTMPCVVCTGKVVLDTDTYKESIADRQLCCPANIHIH